jgi:23S rRNA pseudouridine1911/1915/1917 synthase
VRRTRMTTRRSGGREAISHYSVKKRIDSKYGKFTLLEVQIDTGRTHQIRVHLASLGHPIVGDTLYGAPREIPANDHSTLSLPRNFLHSAKLVLRQPTTGQSLSFSVSLPADLEQFLRQIV